MLFLTRRAPVRSFLVWLLAFGCWSCPAQAEDNALERYVRSSDLSYNWKRNEQKPFQTGTLTHLEMVSQTWRGQFWSHHLLVIRPPALRNPDIALLFVTGGDYNGLKDKDAEPFYAVAERAGALVVLLNKVPNQPLYDGREEDALIAYTFDQYLSSGDESWPLLFAMVKSAVRGMDTVQAFARQEWKQGIDRFVVSGASKRGWTTWLSAAVDPRVKAIAPMVIDTLNFKAQLDWTEKMYGRPSEEIDDYTKIRLHERIDEPMTVKLRGWVDPYSYRQRYTLAKLLLLGTNDPYWVVDSLRHYWDDLPGPKLVFQTPNAAHDLAGGKEALQTLAAWYALVADRQTLPTVEWQLRDGTSGPAGLTVTASAPVRNARLWTAQSTDRDFRNEEWQSRDLPLDATGKQAAVDVPMPASGFTAFMAEVELSSLTGEPYRLSTRVQVLPDLVNRHP